MRKETFKVGYQKSKVLPCRELNLGPHVYRSLAVEKKITKSSPLEGTEPGSLRPQRLMLADGLHP